ncbi:hypothetical protein [Cytobacillus dafuensis]|uniref:Uncharacterized protein n=1 Tax=Cytobacillus dafuensis TaxID=1742359 RepID=A0A5B8Z224_CYTDA|nr:hypothetical protein [Cytobacillus dafuensis]QED46938.1 hypothetical protein FSZ17_06455 [Cytobacillus dafuensis]
MKIKTSFLYAGMAIVLLSLIGNYIVYKSSQLKEPIMLKHYYHITADRGTILELYYIANRNNDVDIQSISIPGIDYSFFSSLYGMPANGQSNNHYQIKTLHIEIDDRIMDVLNGKPYKFDQVTAHLSNGKNLTLPVGEIILFKREASTLKTSSSGSSNDNSGFEILKADHDIEITGLDLPFADALKSALSLKLNGTQMQLHEFNKVKTHKDSYPIKSELFPLNVKKEELFPIIYKFSFAENDPLRFNFYLIDAKLHGKDQNGPEFTNISHLSYRPYFEKKDLKEIVKEAIK